MDRVSRLDGAAAIPRPSPLQRIARWLDDRWCRTRETEQDRDQTLIAQRPRLLQVGDGARLITGEQAVQGPPDREPAGPIHSPQQAQLQTAAATLLGTIETGATVGTAVHERSSPAERLSFPDRR